MCQRGEELKRTEAEAYLGVEAAAVQVDEDDGYVLVARLAETKQTNQSFTQSLIGEEAGKGHRRSSGAGEGNGERKLPAGEGASVARALEDGGLDALAGAEAVAGGRHGTGRIWLDLSCRGGGGEVIGS